MGMEVFLYSTMSPASTVEDETNVITIGTSWSDLAGNAPSGSTSSANYTVDTIRPTVAITSTNSVSHNNQSESTFTLGGK